MDIEKLRSAGINYETGLARFAGKTVLYEKYLNKFKEDSSYDNLTKFLKEKDVDNAFKAAHTLKGIVGNLSMDDLYKVTCSLVEELRDGKMDNADTLFPPVEREYKRVIEALK